MKKSNKKKTPRGWDFEIAVENEGLGCSAAEACVAGGGSRFRAGGELERHGVQRGRQGGNTSVPVARNVPLPGRATSTRERNRAQAALRATWAYFFLLLRLEALRGLIFCCRPCCSALAWVAKLQVLDLHLTAGLG